MNHNDQKFVAEKIRSEYLQKESTELDALRALDAKVKRPANVTAGVVGAIGALVAGSGMSLTMTDLGQTLGIANPMVIGIVIGVVGLGLCAVNYPLYKRILNSRKQQYAEQIMQLSDKLVTK